MEDRVDVPHDRNGMGIPTRGRFATPGWASGLSSEDMRGLSPLHWRYTNPCGRLELHLEERIDFERRAA